MAVGRGKKVSDTGTHVVDKQPGDSLTFCVHTVQEGFVRSCSCVPLCLHFSVAGGGCEAGLVVLLRVQWPFGIAYHGGHSSDTNTSYSIS